MARGPSSDLRLSALSWGTVMSQRGSGAKGAASLFTRERPPLVGEQTEDRGKLRSRLGADRGLLDVHLPPPSYRGMVPGKSSVTTLLASPGRRDLGRGGRATLGGPSPRSCGEP